MHRGHPIPAEARLARTQRRRRIRCRVSCQVLLPPRRAIAAAVLSVSEGGFGLQTTVRVEQGDPIRLRIPAQGSVGELEVEAIVWYDHPAPRARGNAQQRLLGCVVADRSPAFLELFAEVERRNAPPQRRVRAPLPRSAPKLHSEEAGLPRSKDPLPPPKPEPEEELPSFRVRLRQIGGPRTRVVSVRACSIPQAAERARSELSDATGPDRWAVIEVAPIG